MTDSLNAYGAYKPDTWYYVHQVVGTNGTHDVLVSTERKEEYAYLGAFRTDEHGRVKPFTKNGREFTFGLRP